MKSQNSTAKREQNSPKLAFTDGTGHAKNSRRCLSLQWVIRYVPLRVLSTYKYNYKQVCNSVIITNNINTRRVSLTSFTFNCLCLLERKTISNQFFCNWTQIKSSGSVTAIVDRMDLSIRERNFKMETPNFEFTD